MDYLIDGSLGACALAVLLVALLFALGFEFVNGFHDTANAVATVIYTHSLPANVAVVWSGCFNFLGVLLSSGAVAFGIISLLPVELILQVGSSAGFAMVFALLIAAILWNLGTWYLGLPASSSHTLIGSIIGVGVANALLNDTGVVTIGGPDFGILGEGYMRLSYANSTENIRKALDRIRREAVGARCMTTVARGEFQPSASSIALMRTLISPRSYAARVSASRTGGVDRVECLCQ